MIKTKVALLEGQLFSNQSELFEYFLNCSDRLDKSRPSTLATALNFLLSEHAPHTCIKCVPVTNTLRPVKK